MKSYEHVGGAILCRILFFGTSFIMGRASHKTRKLHFCISLLSGNFHKFSKHGNRISEL